MVHVLGRPGMIVTDNATLGVALALSLVKLMSGCLEAFQLNMWIHESFYMPTFDGLELGLKPFKPRTLSLAHICTLVSVTGFYTQPQLLTSASWQLGSWEVVE